MEDVPAEWYGNGQGPADTHVLAPAKDHAGRINTAPEFDALMREYIGRAMAILMSIDNSNPPSYAWPDVLTTTELLLKLEGTIR